MTLTVPRTGTAQLNHGEQHDFERLTADLQAHRISIPDLTMKQMGIVVAGMIARLGNDLSLKSGAGIALALGVSMFGVSMGIDSIQEGTISANLIEQFNKGVPIEGTALPEFVGVLLCLGGVLSMGHNAVVKAKNFCGMDTAHS